MKELNEEEVKERIKGLEKWSYNGAKLKRQYNFKDFAEAIRFVNVIAELAEQHEHHPDIDIRYNLVRISLSTHSIGGITEKDFKLARAIEKSHT